MSHVLFINLVISMFIIVTILPCVSKNVTPHEKEDKNEKRDDRCVDFLSTSSAGTIKGGERKKYRYYYTEWKFWMIDKAF
jgi:hypothetical protein